MAVAADSEAVDSVPAEDLAADSAAVAVFVADLAAAASAAVGGFRRRRIWRRWIPAAGGLGGGGLGGGGLGGGGLDAAGGGFRAGAGGLGGGAGGISGGEFRGAGGEFGAGGFNAGGRGGFGANGIGASEFRAGGFGGAEAGGFRAGGFGSEGFGGATPSRGQLNSFLGLPTDAGMSAAGSAIGARGAIAGPDGFAAGRAGAAGVVREGPNGTTVARGVAGAGGVAAGPGGAVSGGRAAGGTVVRGPDGNIYARGGSASRMSAYGSVGGYGHGGIYSSATYRRSATISCNRWAVGRNYFTPAWTASHPWAWAPVGFTAAAWARAAWVPATWGSVSGWVGWDSARTYYDYGNNVTYQDNSVYYGDQPYASADDYAQQATTLADSAPADAGETSDQWLPLGVFGLMKNGQKSATLVLQIAVNHAGTVRGNAYDPTDDKTNTISGAVDKTTQRVAIRVEGQDGFVIDTGLYNLTQGQAPALLHTADGGTESDLLVRIKNPSGVQNGETADGAGGVTQPD